MNLLYNLTFIVTVQYLINGFGWKFIAVPMGLSGLQNPAGEDFLIK